MLGTTLGLLQHFLKTPVAASNGTGSHHIKQSLLGCTLWLEHDSLKKVFRGDANTARWL